MRLEPGFAAGRGDDAGGKSGEATGEGCEVNEPAAWMNTLRLSTP